ncbi:hypothetical protein GCG54_00010475 [Colletotrichum gloeosporioides]|uniref:Heterokaryon incompatibility domain-containing protein n=1 Tax=Colletotrichum gloeosporioides TaxID=474922 RepID=A0A8H4CJM8_COLGL|nr:uncharacterized protein GCG54_00010475 [Colletotrichum gloeosporioides]KAF3805198.1 hypothetical protein GCG54_00010475 [Colletotrichum gloeosporioides]
MEDDIRNANISNLKFSSQIDGILKHAGPRDNAKRWARNLRFLTFDNGADQHDAATSTPTRGQCRRCAERVPAPAGHMCAAHANIRPTPESLAAWELKLADFPDPCTHVEDLTCDGCQHVPLFPNTGTVSTFRIRRAVVTEEDAVFSECRHFVAVSYCWESQPSDDDGEAASLPPYTVIEEDGTKRAMRAPRATIDRVVRFARENGFRMIWIDQECIDQANPSEKELGIQSMDLVYQRAHTCIGLMSTLWTQAHLEALLLQAELRHEDSGAASPHRRGAAPVRKPRPPMQHFANDLISAVFALITDRWTTRAWVLQESFVSADRMLLLFPRDPSTDTTGWWLICHEKSLSETAVCILMLQDALENHVLPYLTPLLSPSPANPSSSMAVELFERVRFFYPRAIDNDFRIGLGADFWDRKRCDAATALAFLNQRDLFRVADRVAILANLCGYEQRLDTVELEKGGYGLSHCLLALALLNGDLSLLVPEMYKTPEGYPLYFTFLHSLTRTLRLSDAATLTPSSNTAVPDDPRLYTLSSKGLSLAGTLWKVTSFVSLEPIKLKYASAWHRAKLPGVPPSTRRQALTHILHETLTLLKARNMLQLADAIFNSTSDAKYRAQTPDTPLESVLQIPEDTNIANRDGMFWFSWAVAEKLPHQAWIADRIMELGGVWVAEPVDAGYLPFNPHPPSPDPESEPAAAVPGAEQWPSLLSDLDPSAMISFFRSTSAHLSTQTHAERLLQISLLTKFIDLMNDRFLSTSSRSKSASPLRNMVPIRMYSGLLAGQISASEFTDRRAVFDLGGEDALGTLVLTPFQAQLESIPRSKTRGLSVSWVVEEVERSEDSGVGEEEEMRFRVMGTVKGMWRFTLLHSGRYTLV